MERYLEKQIVKDLEKKIVLLSGPRQVGKTTLAKSLWSEAEYLNWDAIEDRALILKKQWNRAVPLVILDELHKMENFKTFLKGIYDKEGTEPKIIVTGSARLDIAKKMGDSLAGRFFPFRLYPFDLWELKGTEELNLIYERLLNCSGFPEPYLSGDTSFYTRWSKTHIDLILRQDLLDLESIKNISAIETLISLLQRRVGSTVSYSSLARDLEKDPKTIKSWLSLLEKLFVIFRLSPYHKNIARSLLKEPKYYFYDQARVVGDEGQKFENLVAISLVKHLHYAGDVLGKFADLHFLRTRDGAEVDFLINWEDSAMNPLLIEVKLSDQSLTPNFNVFENSFQKSSCIQLVKNLEKGRKFSDGKQILPALPWLTKMPIIPCDTKPFD